MNIDAMNIQTAWKRSVYCDKKVQHKKTHFMYFGLVLLTEKIF